MTPSHTASPNKPYIATSLLANSAGIAINGNTFESAALKRAGVFGGSQESLESRQAFSASGVEQRRVQPFLTKQSYITPRPINFENILNNKDTLSNSASSIKGKRNLS